MLNIDLLFVKELIKVTVFSMLDSKISDNGFHCEQDACIAMTYYRNGVFEDGTWLYSDLVGKQVS